MPRLAMMTPIERLHAVASLDTDQRTRLLPLLRPHRVSLPGRYPRSLRESPSGRRYESMLAALECFDFVLEDLVGYKAHIYVLGDAGVGELFSLVNPTSQASRRSLTPDLDILASCGLIYRFNVALKFGYPPRSIMQVRLNGWGRYLVEQNNLAQQPHYAPYREILRDKIRDFTNQYREQIRLCSSDERPLHIERIHALNNDLPVQVVT